MSLEDKNVIDFVTIIDETGDVWMTITDHLPWGDYDDNHLQLLQDKINYYIECIEGGEVFKTFPDLLGKKIVINIEGKYPMSTIASSYYKKVDNFLKEIGLYFRFNCSSS